jgi:hypothetical protein
LPLLLTDAMALERCTETLLKGVSPNRRRSFLSICFRKELIDYMINGNSGRPIY